MTKDSATRVLDAAQAFIQDRGFNAFSYRDLAEMIGIRAASIHYHFPKKVDLARAVMKRYSDELEVRLREIEGEAESHRARLEAFVNLYRETKGSGQICLCGSLIADVRTLPDDVRDLAAGYLDRSAAWVRRTVEEGVAGGEFRPVGSIDDLASTLIAGLQGALLMDRAQEGSKVLERVERTFHSSLGC
jgi:TetR/AcrR family transcriptional repressor of nem operon